MNFTAEHGLQNGAFAGMLDYRALEEIDKIFAFADQLLDGLHVFLNPLQPVLFNGQVDQGFGITGSNSFYRHLPGFLVGNKEALISSV